MKIKTNLLILSGVAVPVAALLVGRWLVTWQTRRDVANLLGRASIGPVNTYNPTQLTSLPPPVRRYFRHVLKSGQSYLRTARLRHDGQFKTDLKKDWISITGDEYFLADTPNYMWIGTTTWFSACDQYWAGRGSLTVRLLGAFTMQRGSGPSYDQGELLRWLAETVWFPTSLLPGGPIVWSPIDDYSATVTITDNGLTVSCRMDFSGTGEIVRCQAQRYSDETHMATWVCHYSDYREIHRLRVPTRAEAAWVIDGEEKPYARFTVREIDYDQPCAYGELTSV